MACDLPFRRTPGVAVALLHRNRHDTTAQVFSLAGYNRDLLGHILAERLDDLRAFAAWLVKLARD